MILVDLTEQSGVLLLPILTTDWTVWPRIAEVI